MLSDIIPAGWRRGVYAAYAVGIVVLGVLQIVFGAAGPLPEWLDITQQAVLYLGAAVGIVAAGNVPATGAADPRAPESAPRHAADPTVEG